MVGMLVMSQTAMAASAGSFTTTASVNMRNAGSTNAGVIRVVTVGTSIEVLEHNPAGWSRVQIGGSTGFIRSDFLRFPVGNGATFRTTTGVNLRASGSTNAAILTTVSSGASVEVLEHNPAGWSRVRVGSANGFIRSDFLTRGGTAGTPTPPPSDPGAGAGDETAIGTMRTRVATNFRTGPSTGYRIIRTLASNTNVEVLENQANGWSRVTHNGTTGFIRSDLLVAPATSTPQPPPQTPPQETTTATTRVATNFRTGPSTNYRIIRTLPANTTVTVLENQANGWSRVTHNNTTGFIRSDLLSAPGSTTPPPQPPPQETTTMVTRVATNLRAGPSTNDRIIRTLPANTSVTVHENMANGWSRVTHNNTAGFIRSDLLSEPGSTTPPPHNPPQDTTMRTRVATNLRAGPSTNDRIIRTLAANTTVTVHENMANGWSRVTHNNTAGFIRSDLLSPPGTSTPINVAGRIWNLMSAQNLAGISDRPEHIAGIIGNLQSEVGQTLCPFQQQAGGNRAGLGLMQWTGARRTAMERFMWDNGINQTAFRNEMNRHLNSTCSSTCMHPPELLSRVLEVQIAFMFHELRNTWERQYMTFVDFPTNRTGVAGARAYAELFCALALRPSNGVPGRDDILDEGVRAALQASAFPDRTTLIALEARRNNAERIFLQFQAGTLGS